MKIASCTLAFNDETIIRPVIRCMKDFVDRHIVILGTQPFNGDNPAPDRTEQICEEEGVDIIKGFWGNEENHRHVGLQACKDCDWVIIQESDEYYTREGLENLIKFLEKTDAVAVAHKAKAYWKNMDYRLEPYPDYEPIIAIRPTVRFTEKRCIDSPYVSTSKKDGFEMHHLCWAEPHDILKKVTNYCHANEFDGLGWYKKHFLNWKFGEKAVTGHGEIWDVVYDPLPEELRRLFQ
jgi:glycosyltransferase involved in cell wall biosynthesis